MKHKSTIILSALLLALIPMPSIARSIAKEDIDFLVSLLTIGGSVIASVLFFVNRIESAKKDAIAFFEKELTAFDRDIENELADLERGLANVREKASLSSNKYNKSIAYIDERTLAIARLLSTMEWRLMYCERDVIDLFAATEKSQRARDHRPMSEILEPTFPCVGAAKCNFYDEEDIPSADNDDLSSEPL
jgi:hypothetical protein